MRNRDGRIGNRAVRGNSKRRTIHIQALILTVLFVLQSVITLTGIPVQAAGIGRAVSASEKMQTRYAVVTTNLERP